MILYQALSSYQILECIVHRQVYYREEKCILILGTYITERMPRYRELETKKLFDEVYLFRFGGYRGSEEEIIRQETRCIVDKCFELGEGDIAVGVCRGVEAGVLDVPFAPCRANAGLMLPCRDNDGAVRILNMGNLPFPQDLKDFHAAKIAERAAFEKRKASFQMVIDDVYSIGKGRLVGRPRY